MSRKFVFGICLLFVFLAPVTGQEVEVHASLDSTDMLIGSQTRIKLEVLKPPGIEVTFPFITDTITRAIEVLNVSQLDSAFTEDDRILLQRQITVTSFDSGYHILPPFKFLSKSGSGIIDTLFTNSLGLNIQLVAVDTSLAIKPIKGPERVPLTFREALPWTLGALLATALALGIFLYFKRRNKSEEPVLRPAPKEPPHIIAFRELEKLKAERLWQSGEIKAYHSRLSDTVREYIEHRYLIPALEQTSLEIFEAFRRSGLSEQTPFEKLEQLLCLADLVKFAKEKPGPVENVRSMEQAIEFVEKTIKKRTEE